MAAPESTGSAPMSLAPLTPLDHLIREKLAAPPHAMTVHDYMALCLGHPRYGYYRQAAAIGRNADFVTAPEISQIFGELLGLWTADIWDRSGRPDRPILVELGPGRGTLMADALRATAMVPAFRQSLEVHLVETNETLRHHQATALKPFDIVPIWHDSSASLPDDRPLFVLANEFFDALPIHQYVWVDGIWRERVVVMSAGSDSSVGDLAFAPGPHAPFVDPIVQKLADAGLPRPHEGAVIETCPAGVAILRDLSATIDRQGGALLAIDYGHDQPGYGDTLQAVSRHARADPLVAPGANDLTAHVDFTALASAVQTSGIRVFGPVSQADFLSELGIALRATALKRNATPEQAAAIDSAVDRLTAPGQMGTLFKVMAAITKDGGNTASSAQGLVAPGFMGAGIAPDDRTAR